MEPITATIIIGIGSAIVGNCLGAYVGYKLGKRANLQNNKRILECKFENAIAKFRLENPHLHFTSRSGKKVRENNVYEDFWLLWQDREKYIKWLKDNDISEVKDFQKWLETKDKGFKAKRNSYD